VTVYLPAKLTTDLCCSGHCYSCSGGYAVCRLFVLCRVTRMSYLSTSLQQPLGWVILACTLVYIGCENGCRRVIPMCPPSRSCRHSDCEDSNSVKPVESRSVCALVDLSHIGVTFRACDRIHFARDRTAKSTEKALDCAAVAAAAAGQSPGAADRGSRDRARLYTLDSRARRPCR